MLLYFAGGESPGWRKRLREAGVGHTAVNWTHLRARLPKKKAWEPSSIWDGGMLLYPTLKDEWSTEERAQYADDYQAFVAEYGHAFDLVIEADVSDAYERRETYIEDEFAPMWTGGPDLQDLCAQYQYVAVHQNTLDDPMAAVRLQSTGRRYGTKLVGLGVTKTDLIEKVRWHAVTSQAWISPSRHGETILWDGRNLRRYPKGQKEEARKKHRAMIERSGVSWEAVMEDDKEAVTQLAIWSYERYAEAVSTRRGTTIALDEPDPEPPEEDELIKSTGGEAGSTNTDLTPVPLDQPTRGGGSSAPNLPAVREERTTIPVAAFHEVLTIDEETGETTTQHVVKSRAESMRQCDSCFLASNCPAYRPQHTCAYDIPLEIQSKDQLMAVMSSMLEMQGQRVLFARMSEELEGGVPDENTDRQIDRFFKLVEQMRDISDNRDFMRIEIEAKGEAGVISRLFGSRAGEQARQLNRPVSSDSVMESMS